MRVEIRPFTIIDVIIYTDIYERYCAYFVSSIYVFTNKANNIPILLVVRNKKYSMRYIKHKVPRIQSQCI